jgi:hypothetical protein
MEFFRKHKKIIVGIITVTVIAWMVGLTMVLPLLAK